MANVQQSLDRWLRLFEDLPAESSNKVFERLVAAYSEPQRAYHTLDHIEDCLALLDQSQHLAKDRRLIEISIWFHDVVYDPKAADNEEQSAKVASRELKAMALSPSDQNQIETLILATKQHQESPDPDVNLLLDIDLGVFGHPQKKFDAYEQNIRQEYSWVQLNTYTQKRSAILENFLSKQHIYKTEFFREKFEALARKNLTRSIASLRCQPL